MKIIIFGIFCQDSYCASWTFLSRVALRFSVIFCVCIFRSLHILHQKVSIYSYVASYSAVFVYQSALCSYSIPAGLPQFFVNSRESLENVDVGACCAIGLHSSARARQKNKVLTSRSSFSPLSSSSSTLAPYILAKTKSKCIHVKQS